MNLNENDFGFTNSADNIVIDYKDRLHKMNNLLRPLVNALLKDCETNPNIHWPNRKEKLEVILLEANKLLQEQ